ncbi:efflux RND transporter periplasmic adaptor subunit [Deminuibacter soli]|uniref:Efflux RND transporter periplasmic adaptor subunit n=1 Tax=Deminuibacter soli TaxID=2291815 RepID=A0A3E1NDU8_9BACT|nr:efflux RND transporter periplasmic adaptor subunit [Deminuibacter soli]RFM25948.1 efflux RND transporter periplasmic adaptor subunit [Deminuibacter soli]
MQKLVNIGILAIAVTFASCGAKTDDGTLAAKKAKLESLKKEVAALESDIAKTDTAAGKEERPKLVTIDTLKPSGFTHYIDLQGKVESVNVSNVTPRTQPGQVKAVFVKTGDIVSKGQVLLQLDDVVAKQNLRAAEQGLGSLKAQLDLAKEVYRRRKNLLDQGIGTEVQVLSDKTSVDSYESQLKSAQENVKLAQEQVNFTTVRSDLDGVADVVNIRVGETFSGANQIRIVNTHDLKITTQIPENYLGRVHVGSHVKVTLPDINRTIDAIVTVAGKLIDQDSRSFYIEAKIPSDKDFHPNQLALVKIQDYSAPGAYTVPLNTVQTDEKGKYVMVAVTEKQKVIAKKRAVVIGELYGDRIEIKSGLQTGDHVIVDGYQSLYENQLLTTDAR